MSDIEQTRRSFNDKWTNNQDAIFAATLEPGSDIFNWILGRNGFDGPAAFSAYLASFSRILDAGCGNGRVTALLRAYAPAATEIVGIDVVSAKIAESNLAGASGVSFREADLLGNLDMLGSFDFI